MNLFRKSILAAGLAASAFAATTPAMARDYYRGGGYRGGGDTAAAAVGAGIIGLAVGALIAGSNRQDRYYDNGYYADYGVTYAPGWSYRDGWYWDHDGRRFSREDYFSRNPDFRPHFVPGADRGPPPMADPRRGYGRDRDDFRRGY